MFVWYRLRVARIRPKHSLNTRHDTSNTTKGEPDSPADAEGAVLGQLRFSPSLYVHLCRHVAEHGREMQLAGITDLWSTGGRASGLVRSRFAHSMRWLVPCV